MNRKLLIPAAVLVLLVTAGFVGRRVNAALPAVQASPARWGNIASTVLASGELGYRELVELRPEVIGQVSAVHVQEGDHVEAGQILVELDPASYRARVERQLAVVRQQEASLDAAQIRARSLGAELGRRKAFSAAGYVSRSDFDAQRAAYEVADREVSSQRGALSAVRAELAQAQGDLAKTYIRAPMSGTVTRLNVRPGETVVVGLNVQGTSLLEIAGTSQVVAVVYIDEAEIDSIRAGAPAKVESGSRPGYWATGHVSRVGNSVMLDPAHPGRRFRVEIALDDRAAVREGTSCRAEIVKDARDRALVVPISAVQFSADAGSLESDGRDDNAYVLVVRDGRAQRRNVQLGLANDTNQQILSGLRPGESVVTGPFRVVKHLQSGDRVATAPARPGA